MRRHRAFAPAEPPTAERARAISGLGQMLMLLARYDESRILCEDAVRIARAVGARGPEGHALSTLGLDLAVLGDPAGPGGRSTPPLAGRALAGGHRGRHRPGARSRGRRRPHRGLELAGDLPAAGAAPAADPVRTPERHAADRDERQPGPCRPQGSHLLEGGADAIGEGSERVGQDIAVVLADLVASVRRQTVEE